MRLLIISSSTKIREMLLRALEQSAFTIDAEREFGKGLSSACVNTYHLVVIEHAFPILDAQILCHELRDRERHFPVLVLVPGHDRTLGTRCLDRGADDFISLPLSVSEFLARVRSLLRRPQQIQGEQIRTGQLLIDRRRHTVKRKNREIALTRMEYAVLEILAIHLGGIVSKGEIIEHVWGESDATFLEGALETHIYMLRKKLESGGKRLIHTAIGRGYRLE